MLKTDSLGNLLWQQTIGGSSSDQAVSALPTNDGGYILGGYTESFGAGLTDMYLVKADSLGSLQWQQTFGGSSYDRCYSVQQTTDGGFILGGYTWSFGAGMRDMYLVKTDSGGNLEWEQTFGGSEVDICFTVKQTTDDGYILVGHTDALLAGWINTYLVKTDSQGNLEWEQTFGGSGWDASRTVQQTTDGGYILGGDTDSFGAGGRDMYLVKTDSLGNLEWQQTFGGSSDDYCWPVQQTSDGGYVLGGLTESYGAGQNDMYLVRLEAEGAIPQVTIALSPENPPIIIPASGGSFNFNIEVVNNETMSQTFDIWCWIVTPTGPMWSPILGPINLTFPPGRSIDRDLTQFVPGTAPAGDWSYHSYVGIYPDIIWDSDSFPFEKLAGGDTPSHEFGWALLGWDEDKTSSNLLPSKYAAISVHPNPFNPSTAISFILPQASHVELNVYDLQGRKVVELVNGMRNAGMHEVTFYGKNLASGVYIYRIQTGDFAAVRKMVLMK